MDEIHIAFMRRALVLAKQAKGRTSPNPLVGAVIVKAGKVVGEGYHRKAGGPHAEIDALQEAADAAKGGTLYVNLEPCCHWGRTPPCTDALIQAGIAQVYVAEVDANPKVAGKGIRQLADAGISVNVGICAEEAAQLNEVHRKYVQTGRPFVILKTAMSLDGKIATVTGESQWITSEASRQKVHEIRDEVDAILVGIGTVFCDNPTLTTRLAHQRGGKDATRIVLDSRARTPTNANVFNVESSAGIIIAVTPQAPAENIAVLKKAGADVLVVPAKHGRICFSALMEMLGAREITSVLIEGGGEVNAAAIASGVVDKVLCFIAPKLIGGAGAPGPLGGEGICALADAPRLHNVTAIPVKDGDGDIFVQGYLQNGAG